MSADNQQLAAKIVTSLAYVAQFEFPLRLEELEQRLVGREWPAGELKTAVSKLVAQVVLQTHAGYYWLAQAGEPRWVKQRQLTAKISQDKRLSLNPLLKFIEWLPGIRSVWVTGSVAVGGATVADDTDLMIICLPGTLWLSRAAVTLYSWAHGRLRRFDSQEVHQAWCFNLWLTTKSWKVQPQARSLYTAYEVLQAECVFDRDGHQWRFVHVNDWVRYYLPRWYTDRLTEAQVKLTASRLPWRMYHFWLWWWQFLDLGAYAVQRLYMWPHMTRERVGRQFAFFHPRDTRGQIYEGWRQALEKLV